MMPQTIATAAAAMMAKNTHAAMVGLPNRMRPESGMPESMRMYATRATVRMADRQSMMTIEVLRVRSYCL